jgi:hypothetical protein
VKIYKKVLIKEMKKIEWKEFKASPIYRAYRDKQNTMARARRKERIESDK